MFNEITTNHISNWLTIIGLILAILDFSGLSLILDNKIDKLIKRLHHFIFKDTTGVADKIGEFGKKIFHKDSLTFIIALFGIFATIVGVGAIFIAIAFFFLILFTILSFGLGYPILAGAILVITWLFSNTVSTIQDILPYISAIVGSIVFGYFLLWILMKIAQPIILFFPWSALIPIYWLLHGLNIFPGKMIGTIGLIIALISTIIELT